MARMDWIIKTIQTVNSIGLASTHLNAVTNAIRFGTNLLNLFVDLLTLVLIYWIILSPWSSCSVVSVLFVVPFLADNSYSAFHNVCRYSYIHIYI